MAASSPNGGQHESAYTADVTIKHMRMFTQRWVLGMAASQINIPHRKQVKHAAVDAWGLSSIVDAPEQRLGKCSIYSYSQIAYWGSCVDGSAYKGHDDS